LLVSGAGSFRIDWTCMYAEAGCDLTHESDLDGLVAGVLLQRLARKLFDTNVRLEACHYNNWKQREPREKAAWVTDLNFEARLDKPNWVVIDHHATEAPAKNALLIHDLNKSAGLLSTSCAGSTGWVRRNWTGWCI